MLEYQSIQPPPEGMWAPIQRPDKQLLLLRKGDSQQVWIAARLRRETTMTLGWIAEHWRMGAPTHVAFLLYRLQRKSDGSGDTKF
jgi:hypothetical protein